MRIGVAALLHESNTFIDTPTTLADFEDNTLVEGGRSASGSGRRTTRSADSPPGWRPRGWKPCRCSPPAPGRTAG
jgi:microcystin degradation protein MlrC